MEAGKAIFKTRRSIIKPIFIKGYQDEELKVSFDTLNGIIQDRAREDLDLYLKDVTSLVENSLQEEMQEKGRIGDEKYEDRNEVS